MPPAILEHRNISQIMTSIETKTSSIKTQISELSAMIDSRKKVNDARWELLFRRLGIDPISEASHTLPITYEEQVDSFNLNPHLPVTSEARVNSISAPVTDKKDDSVEVLTSQFNIAGEEDESTDSDVILELPTGIGLQVAEVAKTEMNSLAGFNQAIPTMVNHVTVSEASDFHTTNQIQVWEDCFGVLLANTRVLFDRAITDVPDFTKTPPITIELVNYFPRTPQVLVLQDNFSILLATTYVLFDRGKCPPLSSTSYEKLIIRLISDFGCTSDLKFILSNCFLRVIDAEVTDATKMFVKFPNRDTVSIQAIGGNVFPMGNVCFMSRNPMNNQVFCTQFSYPGFTLTGRVIDRGKIKTFCCFAGGYALHFHTNTVGSLVLATCSIFTPIYKAESNHKLVHKISTDCVYLICHYTRLLFVRGRQFELRIWNFGWVMWVPHTLIVYFPGLQFSTRYYRELVPEMVFIYVSHFHESQVIKDAYSVVGNNAFGLAITSYSSACSTSSILMATHSEEIISTLVFKHGYPVGLSFLNSMGNSTNRKLSTQVSIISSSEEVLLVLPDYSLKVFSTIISSFKRPRMGFFVHSPPPNCVSYESMAIHQTTIRLVYFLRWKYKVPSKGLTASSFSWIYLGYSKLNLYSEIMGSQFILLLVRDFNIFEMVISWGWESAILHKDSLCYVLVQISGQVDHFNGKTTRSQFSAVTAFNFLIVFALVVRIYITVLEQLHDTLRVTVHCVVLSCILGGKAPLRFVSRLGSMWEFQLQPLDAGNSYTTYLVISTAGSSEDDVQVYIQRLRSRELSSLIQLEREVISLDPLPRWLPVILTTIYGARFSRRDGETYMEATRHYMWMLMDYLRWKFKLYSKSFWNVKNENWIESNFAEINYTLYTGLDALTDTFLVLLVLRVTGGLRSVNGDDIYTYIEQLCSSVQVQLDNNTFILGALNSVHNQMGFPVCVCLVANWCYKNKHSVAFFMKKQGWDLTQATVVFDRGKLWCFGYSPTKASNWAAFFLLLILLVPLVTINSDFPNVCALEVLLKWNLTANGKAQFSDFQAGTSFSRGAYLNAFTVGFPHCGNEAYQSVLGSSLRTRIFSREGECHVPGYPLSYECLLLVFMLLLLFSVIRSIVISCNSLIDVNTCQVYGLLVAVGLDARLKRLYNLESVMKIDK